MNEKNREILLITMEECAEVTQAISKVLRFGLSNSHNDVSNKAHLEEEIGDLTAMLLLIMDNGIADNVQVDRAARMKIEKLSKWSEHNRD